MINKKTAPWGGFLLFNDSLSLYKLRLINLESIVDPLLKEYSATGINYSQPLSA